MPEESTKKKSGGAKKGSKARQTHRASRLELPPLPDAAKALLPAFKEHPTATAYRAARRQLTRIVLDQSALSIGAEDQFLFLLCCEVSQMLLPGYATLDMDHINDIRDTLDAIVKYGDDPSQKRPLNYLMLASPGAGKSHFIRCMAKKLGAKMIGAVTYNMVGLQRHEDLIPALDAARNLKVDDRLPLLFLDEFDVTEAHVPLLLPLLWDGQLTLGQHDLKLGKTVIVLAGSDPRLPGAMEHARGMKQESHQAEPHHHKLVDLLSRINGGVLRLPDLCDPLHVAERRPDKICIAVQLLRTRFGPTLKRVPIGLLRFIANAEFRYGARSMAHLIDLIPHKPDVEELDSDAMALPLDSPKAVKGSSLAYHLLHEDQAHGIAAVWAEAFKNPAQLTIASQVVSWLSSRFMFGRDAFALEFVWRQFYEELGRSEGGSAAAGPSAAASN